MNKIQVLRSDTYSYFTTNDFILQPIQVAFLIFSKFYQFIISSIFNFINLIFGKFYKSLLFRSFKLTRTFNNDIIYTNLHMREFYIWQVTKLKAK